MNIKNFKIALFLAAMIFVFACKKDLGNYKYSTINSAEISNIDTVYTKLRSDTLKIEPKLNFSTAGANDTSKYTYKWFYQAEAIVNIGNNKNLKWVVSLPSTDKPYKFYFQVTEKSTGLIWRTPFALNVSTNIADGWLILNDINGEAQLDFLNYLSKTNSFQHYKDVLKSQSDIKLEGKPKSVYYCQRIDPFTFTLGRSIFLSTDKRTLILNTQNNTFDKYTNLLESISSYYPGNYYAESVRSMGSGYTVYLYDSEGYLNFENPLPGYAFGTPVNKLNNAALFKISPYYAENFRAIQNYALMYDTERKRFMEHKNSDISSSVPVTSSQLFDPGNMKMTLLYMSSTPALNGQTYALLKDDNNKVFLARIVCSTTSFNPVSFDEITNAPELVNAQGFAIDPIEGYLMYYKDSKVYRYNPFDKTNAEVVDLGSRKISMIKYQKMVYKPTDARYVEYSKKLIICSYETASPSTSGKLDLYTVPNLNGNLTLFQSFSGLGKIVDVSYRE